MKPANSQLVKKPGSGANFRQKRSYVPVEPKRKQRLIDMVLKRGKTIKEAAHLLQVNYSTAKHIIKTHKQDGKHDFGNELYMLQDEDSKNDSSSLSDHQSDRGSLAGLPVVGQKR